MKKMTLLSSVITLMVVSCATSIQPIQPVDTSQITYRSNSFNFNEFTHSSIAVLPVLTNVPKYEGIRRRTGQSLSKSIKQQYPSMSVKDPQESLALINSNAMSDIYSDMMTAYTRTGILNQNIMANMGDALKCRFILYTRLGAEETVDTDYSPYIGVTKSTVTELNIYSQLWDIGKGDVVWEGTGGAAMIQTSQENINEELINLASKNLAVRLGKTSTDVKPADNVQKLHEAYQMNYYLAYAGVSLVVSVISLIILAVL